MGLGETDYSADYLAAKQKAPGYALPSPESLATTAFERALADSGLKREEIDGISVSFLYGGPDAVTMGGMLGLNPRHAIDNGGIMAGPLPIVCADIAAGMVDTVAMQLRRNAMGNPNAIMLVAQASRRTISRWEKACRRRCAKWA